MFSGMVTEEASQVGLRAEILGMKIKIVLIVVSRTDHLEIVRNVHLRKGKNDHIKIVKIVLMVIVHMVIVKIVLMEIVKIVHMMIALLATNIKMADQIGTEVIDTNVLLIYLMTLEKALAISCKDSRVYRLFTL